MEGDRKEKDLVKSRGTCELCGAHKKELRVLILSDFIGWACQECMRQLRKSTPRRYCSTGEEKQKAQNRHETCKPDAKTKRATEQENQGIPGAPEEIAETAGCRRV